MIGNETIVHQENEGMGVAALAWSPREQMKLLEATVPSVSPS